MAEQETRRQSNTRPRQSAPQRRRTEGTRPQGERPTRAQQPNRQPAHACARKQPAPQQQGGGNKTAIVITAVAVLVAVVVAVVLFLTQCQGKQDVQQQQDAAAQNATTTQGQANNDAKDATDTTGTAESEGAANATGVDKTSWELTLVNKTHPLPADWKVELAEVADSKYVDARIADQFNQMIEDCRAAGFDDVFVNQAYRSHEEQQAIWDEFYNGFIAEGYSEEEATKLTGESVAVPGTSEHELGLAADICSINFDETYNAPIQTWLQENGHKYGFIQRYPKGKESITGTKNENWHFRYVGMEAATKIHESGQVLEEYLGEVDAATVSAATADSGTADTAATDAAKADAAAPDSTTPDANEGA